MTRTRCPLPSQRRSIPVHVRLSTALLLLATCIGCDDWHDDPDPRPVQAINGQTSQRSLQTELKFTTLTADSGVKFRYRDGQQAGHVTILESLGGGLAAVDYDSDGDMDLFCTGGGHFGPQQAITGNSPALFRNLGNWTFEAVTDHGRLQSAPYYSHGVAVADADNDGFPDLLVTGYGGLLLFHNQGDGTFSETSAAAGLADDLWSSSAGWGDVDNDGLADLYVTHYVDWSWDKHPRCPGPSPTELDVCPPKQFGPLPDTLYLNNGDGTYRDGTSQSGLRADGKGLGVLLADLDADRPLDIYVTNDTTPNFLYHNQGGGRFDEQGLVSGTGLGDRGNPDGSMGVELCDFDRDGQPDLWVSNYERESFALYRNLGKMSFRHVSRVRGIMAVGGLYVGWGTCVADFDLDGDEDIFVANGHVIRYPTNSTVQQRPLLFDNNSVSGFSNVASIAGDYMSAAHAGRGAIAADFDNDGDLDLGVSHINAPISLLVNKADSPRHWLAIRLVGTHSARDAVGATVRVRTAHGVQTRYTRGGGSFASAGDPRLYFGLADADRVQSVSVDWLSGARTHMKNVDVDTELLLIEPPLSDQQR